ncbi:MAG: glycosyltransferase family 2 protein [Algicola sp.]|nr:glycosyltransferase family 2 protein [Algicola sp.]
MKEQVFLLDYVVHFFLDHPKKNPVYELLKIYNTYNSDLLKKIRFILIDDHSATTVSLPEEINLNITLFRIKDDIMWNQAGARNLGLHVATAQRIILTDLDIVFPETLLEHLVDFNIPPHTIYKFVTYTNLKPTRPHVNIFYSTKDTFMKTNGVDEEFSGHYDEEDIFFYHHQKAMGTRFLIFKHANIVLREHRNTTEKQHNKLIRDRETNLKLYHKKMALLNTLENPMDVRSPLHLNFHWETVAIKTIN